MSSSAVEPGVTWGWLSVSLTPSMASSCAGRGRRGTRRVSWIPRNHAEYDLAVPPSPVEGGEDRIASSRAFYLSGEKDGYTRPR